MKKQVIRRRLHSNKPYQERLLNMAEARREIATALKFHRASMNQQEAGAGANHHQQQQQGTSTSNNNYYPISTIIVPPPLPLHHQHLNLALPNQTLGLNLNFQDFNDLNTSVYHSTANSSGGVVLESDEMKEIRSLNRVCKSIKTTEIGPADDEDDGYHPFEQVMEFPPWLINANESSCLHDHHFSDDYCSQDPALPWMDIGEIEGMDGEWLA